LDVLASYGVVQHKPGYDLLRKVSHWTEADVQRERDTTREKVSPTHTISQFSDMLTFFRREINVD
jgi:phosphoglycolate phosphatase